MPGPLTRRGRHVDGSWALCFEMSMGHGPFGTKVFSVGLFALAPFNNKYVALAPFNDQYAMKINML